MEFKTCPKYKECSGHDMFVIKCNSCPYYKGYKTGYAKAKKKYERPTGKWEKVIDHYQDKVVFRCSICGRFVRDCYRDDLAELYPYCNCGAKMEAENVLPKAK